MVGYENEADLLGKNMHQLIHHTHPDGTNYQEKECPIFNAFKKGHSIHVVDEVFWRKDGTSFPVEYWSYPVRTEGKVVGAVVTFLDITMRKATEQALRESESKHRMLVQTMPDGLVMTNTKGAIIYANKSFCRMLGKQEKELAGHYLSNYLDPDSPAPPKPAPNEQPHELTWLTLDNSKITTLVSPGTIYDQEDKPTSHLLVVTDITQQKLIKEEKDKLSNQLRQVQKMEAIGTLAGGIAHDFNNILAAIIGYTEIALMDLPPNHKARSSLLESLKASKRARALVRQILSFSRQDQLLKKPLRLTPIIKEALKLMRSTLPSTIAIETNFKAKKDTILADSTQIHQVVMNLCTNAAHAMEPEGGKLTVTIEEIELDELMVKQSLKIPEGSYLCLSLSDTGKGMDKTLSQRIFDPFFTTKKQGRGVGMGLSVVHGIVSNHGGAITVYSEPGQGSLFRVYLPLVEMKQIKSSSKFPPHLKTGSEKILFVDDEPSVAQVGTAILNKLGYKVQTFSESLKALNAFKKAPYDFDLVITDQTMPEITGEQLAIEILQVRPEMPVLICTGFSEHITEKKLQKIGVKKLVFKPLNTREVAQVVRQVLDEPPKTTRPQTPQKNQVSNNQ
jgi:PAS domain S-box-containing protein